MRCKGHTRSGDQCKRSAIRGGTVCRVHGGAIPRVKALAAVRAEVESWRIGDAVDDPGEVLLRLITQSRRRADGYAAEIDRKIADGQAEFGEAFTLESIAIGDTMLGQIHGDAVKAGEYVRGIVKLEAEERDRLTSMATKAVAANLEERRVQLAERQANLVAMLLQGVMNDASLGFTVEQRQALPAAIRRQLEAVKVGRNERTTEG